MKQNKKILFLIILLCISFCFLGSNFISLKNHNVYSNKHYIKDRFYSYDDIYYIESIFNGNDYEKYNRAYTAVKHPLLTFNANKITKVADSFIDDNSINNHFVRVECLQLLFSIIGVIYLYLILTNVIKLRPIYCFLLSLVFLFSNATIISSLIVESFVFSSTLLIMSYYYISKKKPLISGLLGALVLGTTITNIVIWGIMLILLNLIDMKYIIKTILYFILSCIIIYFSIWIIESNYLNFLSTNFFDIIFENQEKFSVVMSISESIKYAFYFLGISGLFYIDTVNTDQLGRNMGYAISFIPSAKILITLLVSTIYITIATFSIKLIKELEKNTFACYGIILFNIYLHFILKFGLTEAFLYTPHFIFAIIILFATVIKKYEQKHLIIYISLFTVILFQLFYNSQSIADIISLVS